MKRKFSIITVSKGRLEHLKQTLPRMLEQGASEVVVVDYSCPQGTGEHVREHFPGARVVTVEGETYFSNWKGRNAGAAAAQGDTLVFCDADTILAPGALEWIDEHLPPRSFGLLTGSAAAGLGRKELRLARNQLKGFHVIPVPAFRRAQGYDEVLEGYGAGGDTDLADRLTFMGLSLVKLDPAAIVADVVPHGNEERIEHHREPISVSYGAGVIYRTAKLALLRVKAAPELPLKARRKLYASAHAAASALGSQDSAGMSLTLNERPAGMPRQLGFEAATINISLHVGITGTKRIDQGTGR